MKTVAKMLIYFGLFQLYLGSFGNRDNFTMAGFLLSVLFAAPFLLAGSYMFSKVEGQGQTTVDTVANEIVVAGGEGHIYFLYLRPFDSTNAYKLTDAHRNALSMEVWQRDGFDDIERLVARAVELTAPLIALGRAGEHRGAGRGLTGEDDWRQKVRQLARNAKMIIILPSSHAGTLFELELIVTRQFLTKTLFIMPPYESTCYTSGAGDVQQEWARTQQTCSAFGLALPDALPGGAIFKVRVADRAGVLLPLPGPDPSKWTKGLQVLIDA